MAGLKKARRVAAKSEAAKKAQQVQNLANQTAQVRRGYNTAVETPAAPDPVNPLVMTTGDMDKS